MRIITDFDGPIMDLSDRYYHVYQLCLAQVKLKRQPKNAVKDEFGGADCEQNAVCRIFPLQDEVDVEDQLGRALIFAKRSEPKAMDVHVVPRQRVEVFGMPRTKMHGIG